MSDKPARVKLHFKGITSTAWEHPADRAALLALQKVPGLDTAIKAMIGNTTETSLRLIMLASAVRVNEKQFARVHKLLLDCCAILDVEKVPELYVSQSPVLNAGAVGVENPFIVLNSSMVDSLNDEELMAVIGHELGHILSGHVLYKTLLIMLVNFSVMIASIPLSALAVGAIIAALREWDRKSELSADRAGLLVVQNPEVSIQLLMKLAGGNHLDQMDLGEFIKQADEYEKANSVKESVYKILNSLGRSHPFPVVRISELLKWVQSGGYDTILRGVYAHEQEKGFTDSAKEAAQGYKEDIIDVTSPIFDQAKESAGKVKDFFGDIWDGRKNN